MLILSPTYHEHAIKTTNLLKTKNKKHAKIEQNYNFQFEVYENQVINHLIFTRSR